MIAGNNVWEAWVCTGLATWFVAMYCLQAEREQVGNGVQTRLYFGVVETAQILVWEAPRAVWVWFAI